MRQLQNLYYEREDRYGCNYRTGWTAHIEGACGELVVAKALNRHWSGNIGDLEADDVGPYQVRTTTYIGPNAKTRIHKGDADHKRFVGVSGRMPNYEILGWIVARDGKREEWWDDPTHENRPAYFVPRTALNPNLLDILHE